MTVISYVQDRCRAARHIQVLFIHLQSIYKAAISVGSLSFMLLFLMLYYTVTALELLWEITCHLSSTAAFSYGLRVCTGTLTFTPISLGLYHLCREYSWHCRQLQCGSSLGASRSHCICHELEHHQHDHSSYLEYSRKREVFCIHHYMRGAFSGCILVLDELHPTA